MPPKRSAKKTGGRVGARSYKSPEKVIKLLKLYDTVYRALLLLPEVTADQINNKAKRIKAFYNKVVAMLLADYGNGMLECPTPDERHGMSPEDLAIRGVQDPPLPVDPDQDPEDVEATEEEVALAFFINADYGPKMYSSRRVWCKKMRDTIYQGSEEKLTKNQTIALQFMLKEVCLFAHCYTAILSHNFSKSKITYKRCSTMNFPTMLQRVSRLS
jgi:hypothetical protein